ncbi:MAG: HlyD family efflux transporter periplasmic adaptor subunit [Defluviitaleaceae bacterium]|nr:HlyD family efflux transporter periplasmic adaptor subunit [Defluviitaleaceae bacterium]
MKKHVKIFLIVAILISCAAGGIFYFLTPVSVKMTEIVPRAAELSFTEQGVLRTGRAILIFPAASGEIKFLHAREGQKIFAGDAIVTVDDSALVLRLEQVENGIRALEAQLENIFVEAENSRRNLNTTLQSLRGELRALDAQAASSGANFANRREILAEQIRAQEVVISAHENELSRVRETLERTEILFEGGVVPRVELNSAQTAVSVAEKNLEAANSQLAVIIAGVGAEDSAHFEGARASLEAQIAGINSQLAQDMTTAARASLEAQIAVENLNAKQITREIENSKIISPVDGTISILHAQNTNFISAASPVAEIISHGDAEIDVFVSTQDVANIKIGDRVMLTLRRRAADLEFFGEVIEIDTTAVVRHTALGVEERKVNVKISPQIPPETEIGDGFAIDTTFFLFREENKIIVPRTAIFKADGANMVWLAKNGTAHAVTVVTGTELRTEIIVENGLSAGDLIINDANNADLREGVRVVRE